MTRNLTPPAKFVVEAAEEAARERGSSVTSGDLLVSLIREEDCIGGEVLRHFGGLERLMTDASTAYSGSLPHEGLNAVVRAAHLEAEDAKTPSGYTTTKQLLLAILGTDTGRELLSNVGIDPDAVAKAVIEHNDLEEIGGSFSFFQLAGGRMVPRPDDE